MVTSAERLRRLLALVPYVVARRAVGLAETAATFGMAERELIDDLNLAWCVELKSPEPYCPIDLSYEDGLVTISQAESIARPLRLAADEASALLVALRMLAEAGGDGDAVTRLIAKIEDAAGASAAASSQVSIQIEGSNESGVPAALDAALAARKRVHLRYYVPSRDEATERDVDPMRLLVVEGRTYLEGWCRLGRRGAEIPARPGTRRHGARRARLGAGGGGVGGRGRGAVPAVGGGCAGRARACRRGALGRGVLPVRVGDGAGGGAVARSRFAPRTPACSGGWRSASARRRGSRPRPSWRTRSAPPPRPRWPSMTEKSLKIRLRNS